MMDYRSLEALSLVSGPGQRISLNPYLKFC
ncbi:MAG: hypothetical protein BWX75_00280 [Candidatus Cloacimonetes bacterium ADurb.Bin088]|jgi:hypothetical protein|nr:MAG: hypothetical protein BWX75_00280 [Candidatus Cloacimonetes bacterium ADurb.Bin088]